MASTESPDQEPTQPQKTITREPSKGRQSFAGIRRELSDEELSTPAVQKLLIGEIDRLEGESGELRLYREQFYTAERKCAVLEERGKASASHELLYGVCLAMGSAALGSAPTLWAIQPAGYISVVFGLLLVGGGVASKVFRK
jgi:hypothetical protein